MDKKGIVTAFLLAAGLLGTPNVQAQRTYEEMEQLTVNEQVTTVITASEPVRFVDISTDKIVGDQPIDNIVRLKPKEGGHEDGEVLVNPEKPDVPLNKNDAFQKVQKRRVQEKR